MKTVPPVPEKRRARRARPRAVRMVVLCVAVCAAIVGTVFLLNDASTIAPVVVPSATPDARVTLADFMQDDIIRIEITPGGDAPYAIVRGEDGAFSMEGDASFVLDTWLVSDMLSACDTIRLEPVLALGGDASAEADFGLSEDSLCVTVQYADGTRLTLRFGARVAYLEPERVYVRSDDFIYLAYPSALLEPLDRTRASLRDVPQIDIPYAALCGLTYARETDVISLEKTDEGWRMVSPVAYPADEQTAQSALAAALALRVMPPPDDAPAFVPEATLTLTGEEGVLYLNEAGQFAQTDASAQVELVMGQTLPGGNRLARLDGASVMLASSSLAFLENLTARALAAQKPITAAVQSVTRLEITEPDASQVYEITRTERVLPNNELETDEQGNLVYDTSVVLNGVPCPTDAFLAVYAEAAALSATGSLPDGWHPAPDDVPLKTIVVSTAQGTHTLELYAFDALHAALWLDGAGFFIAPKPVK